MEKEVAKEDHNKSQNEYSKMVNTWKSHLTDQKEEINRMTEEYQATRGQEREFRQKVKYAKKSEKERHQIIAEKGKILQDLVSEEKVHYKLNENK